MYKLCIFGGTTEGRKLAEFLSGQPAKTTVCVATDYGKSLLHDDKNFTVSAQRLSPDEIKMLLRENAFDMVIDATHPYAASATENIAAACREENIEYLRLLRESGAAPENAVFVRNAAEAAEYLDTVQGNILLTTGSKELDQYAGIRDFSGRVWVRVLPMQSSLEACRSAGVKPSNLIAMQGPFSEEMNEALFRFISADYVVTKDGGETGGFAEKIAAAQKTGAKLVVIGRPPQREGIGLSETIELLCSRFDLKPAPRVTVAGIGPGNRDVMTAQVQSAVNEADCLIGAKRMLESISHPGQEVFDAVSPTKIADYIRNHPEHRKFTVLMSGDVGFFSGAKKLLPLLSGFRVEVLPGINSLVYLCAKLGVGYEDVALVSLHGRKHDIVPDVLRNSRVFALVGGEDGIKDLCLTLMNAGLGSVKLHVGERLSYPDEKITVGLAEELSYQKFDTLSVALIENNSAGAVVTHGLPDEAFCRGEGKNGLIPMTKSEIRSVCLSKLRLTKSSVCWDVGAGTGSVSVEMALQAAAGQTYAIEKNEDAVELLKKNKEKFSLDRLTIVPGCAPQACAALPAPTHVFIGGSAGNLREILHCILTKNPSARIVATAVSLEAVSELTACMKEYSFSDQEVVSLSVARSRAAGRYHLMTGQNPITIFTLQNIGGSL